MPAAAPLPPPARPQVTRPVPLADVAGWVGAQVLPGAGAADVVVTGVTLGSRSVVRGDLYAALPGARVHGASYAAEAVAAGAVAVLTDPAGAASLAAAAVGTDVPVLVVDDPRRVLGRLASRTYGDPSSALTLLGVTGTQGKTTTTRLLEGALLASGTVAGVVGTVGTRVAGQDVATGLTTPEAPDLHALFALMVERGVTACAMEVSSHALVMGRVDGVVFDAAAFLNLGRDHLDFHADVEDYFAAKAGLFTPERARRALVNADDPYGRRLLADPAVPTRAFATVGDADWRAEDVELRPESSVFVVVTPAGDRLEAEVPLPGTFNVANALCAVALAGEAGLDPATVASGMGRAGGVPGRLERVVAGQGFLAVVDYAHKPDAVVAVLQALRPSTAGRLVVVIGAGGDRDPGKRPEMGRAAATLADVVVVTDDNPRTEDPAAIRAAVLEGTHGGTAEVLEVGDRRQAIRTAVDLAGDGDTVVVAGKGHETGQTVGDTTHPFDDRAELRAAIEQVLP